MVKVVLEIYFQIIQHSDSCYKVYYAVLEAWLGKPGTNITNGPNLERRIS